ncbi:hypothetical protein PRIPAC_88694 [Pristionchus pacificus]|uniref:Uncharacterized protein n=1 Tax=Pristionchus pacificus TaxID=54126 RepID=A0A2A6CYZ9_PRIPA|nr:hypothetical protein PRIPAC_88694 [Pristionchus pacificus]|eukprot:PDM83444.1 hypothetical protein PRIPAC_35076 [Pristionchus pacificus]
MSFVYASLAGISASLSSISGKFVFSDEFRPENQLAIATFVVLFVLTYISMWYCHTKALSLSSSTVTALLINTSCNFIVTGIAGTLLFHEYHSLLWWSGLPLILIGCSLIMTDGKSKSE